MLPKRVKVYAAAGIILWSFLVIYVLKYYDQSVSVVDLALLQQHGSRRLVDNPFRREIANVCMSADGERLIGLVAAINSIYKNTKNPVKFYILVTDDAYQPLLDWFSRTELKDIQREIKVFDVTRIARKIRVGTGRQELAKPMNYARFYYTEYFPELQGRAIHIDDDCIIQGDVSELNLIPLTANQTAAFSDDCATMSKRIYNGDRVYFKYINFSNPNVRSVNLDPMECSFNTGVYVFDVDAWRMRNVTEQLDYWLTLNTRESVYGNVNGGGGSQPPMMLVFYRQYVLLNPLWNLRHLGMLSSSRRYSADVVSGAKLLHWSGPAKPWHGQAAYTTVWDRYYVPDPNHVRRPVRKYGANGV